MCVSVCVRCVRMKGEHGDKYRRKCTGSPAQITGNVRGEGQGCAGGGQEKMSRMYNTIALM